MSITYQFEAAKVQHEALGLIVSLLAMQDDCLQVRITITTDPDIPVITKVAGTIMLATMFRRQVDALFAIHGITPTKEDT